MGEKKETHHEEKVRIAKAAAERWRLRGSAFS
jgi:hypothetical protein